MNLQAQTLLREAEQLDNRTLDDFIDQVVSLRVRRSYPQQEEALLLKRINKGLPTVQVQRLRALKQKLRQDGLTPAEHDELVRLIEKTENLTVRRLKYLTTLARLRHTTVRDLMQQLGLGTSHERLRANENKQ
ncbi:hypothetical protein DYU11_04530 [Fibrisoma montanum]|uniref:STAS/SEC14 domain-containing protein n=1 Tax=Fibrisoma montanum TaxID=2305895 RepID=A0A418MJK3_9BACT|nr:hypothetical protein [Fibrisoma montanum]RIV27577.1 hypothetical protein DYU11_04530 [Fibrisoma montanum]